MDKVHDIVRDRLLKAADRQKRRYDLTCNTREYKVGDGVLLQDNRKYKGRSPKLQNKWEETSRPNIMVLGDSPKVSCSDDL
jgi:hypothetical protein